MYAIERGDQDIVDLVMSMNPCVTLKNNNGQNALDYALGANNPVKASLFHILLDKFNIIPYDYPNDNEIKYTCSICHENNKDQEIVKLIYCSHLFHKECIDGWIGNNSCPLCREKIIDPDTNVVE